MNSAEAARHEGGCACGQLRYVASGDPLRVGICHCMTCRKRHGAPFNVFVIYPKDRVEVQGETQAWASSDHAQRFGCQICGSPVFLIENGLDEIELYSGGFDEVGSFTPTTAIWTRSREPWLPTLAE